MNMLKKIIFCGLLRICKECDFIIYSAQLFRCTEINRRKEEKSDADAVIEGHSGASRSVCAYQTRRLIVFASNVNRAITWKLEKGPSGLLDRKLVSKWGKKEKKKMAQEWSRKPHENNSARRHACMPWVMIWGPLGAIHILRQYILELFSTHLPSMSAWII